MPEAATEAIQAPHDQRVAVAETLKASVKLRA
jgi:hypothetical protein